MLLEFRPPLRAQVLVSERIPYKFQLFPSFEVSIAAHHGPPQLPSFTSSKPEQRPDRDGSEHSNAYEYPPQQTRHCFARELDVNAPPLHSLSAFTAAARVCLASPASLSLPVPVVRRMKLGGRRFSG
jgi:hypothetical protein